MKMNAKKLLYTVPAALTLAGTILIGGSVVARQKHYEPTGPDAFLRYQVDSTDELVQALREDPKLRKRYAKHFRIPESEVVEWVKHALVPTRLTADRQVSVYGVTKTGRIYPVKTTLKKGTKVWATRSGVPVLKWACANPLTRNMPGTRLPAPARSAVTRGAVPTGRINTRGLVPAAIIAPAAVPAAAAPMVAAVPAGGTGVVAAVPLVGSGGGGATAAPASPGLVVPVPGSTGGGGGGISPALLLIPVGLALLPRGGGGETAAEEAPQIIGAPPAVPPLSESAAVVVPEPATAVLLAAGLLPAISALLLSKQRKER